MKKKTSVIIGISVGLLFIAFCIFELFTLGGFMIYDIEDWGPSNHIEEQFVGDFRPKLSFSGKSKQITIIPLVLRKITRRATNSIGIRRKDGSSYGYDRFEYVRFTKFEVHYESGHVQKLFGNDSSIREKRFIVSSESDDYSSLFKFNLDRMEKCAVVVEGYSKLIKGDKEEVFRLTKGYHIRKRKSVRTGRDRLGSV